MYIYIYIHILLWGWWTSIYDIMMMHSFKFLIKSKSIYANWKFKPMWFSLDAKGVTSFHYIDNKFSDGAKFYNQSSIFTIFAIQDTIHCWFDILGCAIYELGPRSNPYHSWYNFFGVFKRHFGFLTSSIQIVNVHIDT